MADDSALPPTRRIGLTDEQIAQAKWGTGYGGKRHLVDQANIRRSISGIRVKTVIMNPAALCSTDTVLEFLDSVPEDAERIESIKPCLRCLAKAQAQGL